MIKYLKKITDSKILIYEKRKQQWVPIIRVTKFYVIKTIN